MNYDPGENLAVARAYCHRIETAMSALGSTFAHDFPETADRPIRIGYLSRDFCDHPVAHLMCSLFRLHDRAAVEVFAFSFGPDDGSVFRDEIARGCDRFIDIADLSHVESARRIKDEGIDILVDLSGYTQRHRLEICALRPAPIQATYLGFPGSTGAAFVDYIITDRIVSPEDHARFYAEKLVHLPHCYLVSDGSQPIADDGGERSDWGLPADAPVFCSFNQPYKIEPVMFDIWMKIPCLSG